MLAEAAKHAMDDPLVWAATTCLEDSFLERFDQCADVSVPATHTETSFTAIQRAHTGVSLTASDMIQCADNFVAESSKYVMDNPRVRAATTYFEYSCHQGFEMCADASV